MANNRMYLRCPHCPDSKPIMMAKYYPTTGWYMWGDNPEERMNEFFEQHRHDSQWGAGFALEFEIAPDYEEALSDAT